MAVLSLIIKRIFGKIDKACFQLLYCIRLLFGHMEYCTAMVINHDMKCLEKVQRRATWLVKGLEHSVPYDEHLRILGLYSNEQKR